MEPSPPPGPLIPPVPWDPRPPPPPSSPLWPCFALTLPLSQILGIMSVYPGTDSVLEPALGLLTSMMLRLPDVVTMAAEVRHRP